MPTPKNRTKLPAGAAAPALDPHWARLAIGLAIGGYGGAFAYGLWADAGNWLARLEELCVLAIATLLLVFARRRATGAVGILLAVAWLQLLLAIAQWGYYGGGALVALPALIVGAGMALGARGAAWMAAASCAALPAAYWFPGAWMRGGLPFNFRSHGALLVVAEIVFVVTAVLVRAIIGSYHEALERSDRDRKRYGELFALAPDGLLELDGLGVVRDANAAAVRLLGMERADILGENLAWLLRQAGAREAIDLAAVPPDTAVAITLRPQAPDPRSLEIAVQQRLGFEARTMLIVRDVTARRQLEERLAHTQRMETVGRLAGGVAHDFNNLLTVVGGNAGLLAEHRDPDVREMAAEIQEAQRRGAALTRQLLAFARRDLRRAEVLDLASAISGMARLVERLLGVQHRLSLSLELSVTVRADRGQIEQVLLNLASNARDAMPEGGMVAVRCAELERAVAAELGSTLAAERQALLAVGDTGSGMSPEVQARLFEPFFTTKPRGQGTGLGLSMVHGIVLQNEGAVHVVSAVGRGTTVRVFLPACAPVAAPQASAAERPVSPVRGAEHVLLVEDEVAVRRFVERALVDGGYRVTNANDSSSALAVFAAARPPIDLVLTDIVMPGMSGIALARKLAELHGDVPVLFMSGHFEADKGDPELDPSRNLLAKPFSAEELLQRVRERLDAAGCGDAATA